MHQTRKTNGKNMNNLNESNNNNNEEIIEVRGGIHRNNYGSITDNGNDGNNNNNNSGRDVDNNIIFNTPKISHIAPGHHHVHYKHHPIHAKAPLSHYSSQPNSPISEKAGEAADLNNNSSSLRGSFGRRTSSISISSLRSSVVLLGTSLRESFSETSRYVVDKTFVFKGKNDRRCSLHDVDASNITGTSDGASVINETFNLVKNLVGAGALGLPSGVAAFGNAPSALIPSMFIISIMGIIFAYYFWLMGRICKLTNTVSYREAWEVTVGDVGSAFVSLVSALMSGLGNLAYSMILADTTKSLLETTLGLTSITRTQSLLLITIIALLPLCLVKQLKFLAPFSLVGSIGMVYTIVVMGIRWLDGTYDVISDHSITEPEEEVGDGKFIKDIPNNMIPKFGVVGAYGAVSLNVLLLVCMTFQAYFAHYNAPRYYIELHNNTVIRFGIVVLVSFGISAIIYGLMSTFGFLTFGSNCNGFILNNYSNNDILITISRFAIAVALIFTYPLPFIGTRDAILDLLEVPPSKQTTSNLNMLTVVILCIFTILAMIFTDLGIVNAVGGGTLGTLVVFVFPAIMLYSYVNERIDHITNVNTSHHHIYTTINIDDDDDENDYDNNTPGLKNGSNHHSKQQQEKVAQQKQKKQIISASLLKLKNEAMFAIILMWIGILMGGIGVWIALTGKRFGDIENDNDGSTNTNSSLLL